MMSVCVRPLAVVLLPRSTPRCTAHGSGNVVFVACGDATQCATVEQALIWAEKPPYNKQGKIIPLSDLDAATLVHDGDVPVFAHVAKVAATA